MLENAGIPFSWCDAGVDEERLKSAFRTTVSDAGALALALAEAKAAGAYENQQTDDIIIGCDQILVLDGRLFDKPLSLVEAREHLKMFSGKMHQLTSALCMMQSGSMLWSHVDRVNMHVRPLSETFIDQYLHSEGERILSSVGAYLLESKGAQLFERIEGDYFSVLGLPLLPLLEELRKRGILYA